MAAGVAEREIGEQEPRHAAVLDDIARRADDHRRDAVRFQVAGDQTHGLVADRSQRGEDRGLGFVFLQAAQDLGGVLFDRLAMAVVGGGAVEAARQAADDKPNGHAAANACLCRAQAITDKQGFIGSPMNF
mgnify:CR=1 FL=1